MTEVTPVVERPQRGRVLRSPALLAGMIGAAASLVLLLLALWSAIPPPDLTEGGYVRTFRPARTSFEVLLDRGDGQAYAAIALDPTLSDPSVFADGPPQLAFFAQRPVVSYLAFVISGGRQRLLPIAFVAVAVLGAGTLIAAVARLIECRSPSSQPLLAPALLIAPPVLSSLLAFGPDLLGAGLALGGLALWRGPPPRRGWAVAAFALAVVTRESMIVIPAMVMLWSLLRRDAPRRTAVLAGVVPAVAYLIWLVVVRARVGTGPGDIAGRSSFAAPFVGLVRGAANWSGADVVVLALVFAVTGFAAVRARKTLTGWIIVVFLAASVVLNEAVWQSWTEVGRVLVPALALAWVVLAPERETAPGGAVAWRFAARPARL